MAQAIKPFMERQLLAGAVFMVATKDKIIDQEAVGYADLAAKKPMTMDTVFWIASMSKSMTTACLMMLVDEGKVHLDDPVEKYLPEFKGQKVVEEAVAHHRPGKDDDNSLDNQDANDAKQATAPKGPAVPANHPITVREVMSHTAGMAENIPSHSHMLDDLSIKQEVALFAAQPLIHQPGAHFFYSNEGIYTAARIVEVVTGMKFEDFQQQRLFTPLGLTSTSFWPTPAQVARLAHSYATVKGQLTEVPCCNTRLTMPLSDHVHRFPNPAGGLFSTAADVTRFCQMLLSGGTFAGHRYLSETAVHDLTTKQTPAAVTTTYGFGMYQTDEGFRHGGALKTEMWVDQQHGLVRVFLEQKSGPWPGKTGADVEAAIKAAADAMVLHN
jgi:CubicO group peptidase (beta-lactamase class C family)